MNNMEAEEWAAAIDAVKWEAPPGGFYTGKNDIDINFSFIHPSRWRLPVNSVYSTMVENKHYCRDGGFISC